MNVQKSCDLVNKKCLPCEGGVAKLTKNQAEQQLSELPGWKLTHQGERISRKWVVKNFLSALRFFNDVAGISEAEGHHPDLHLSGYRNVEIEIWTHAIGGLSENDFILAAKIDQLPVELQS